MKFLDPTNDYAFKKIFGNDTKKYILISFLNSILGLSGDKKIKEVFLLNPHQAPHIEGAKETILDVRCQDQKGREYIVEMQVIPQSFFDKRVLFYASRAYANQLDQAAAYDGLSPVIFLGILNFEFTKKPHYISTHLIREIETNEHLFKDFSFTLVELPKFKKSEEELVHLNDKWLYFLKHAKELTQVPAVIEEAAIKEAFSVLERTAWDQQALDVYDHHAIAAQDEINRVRYGHEKGMKQGMKQGMEKGMAKGKAEERVAMARNLLRQGVAPEIIATATMLSIPALEKLRDELKAE